MEAFITALASAVGTVSVAGIKLWYDNFKEKKNRTSQEASLNISQEKEDNRTKMQIDANIVWAARVEWIQSVRNVASEFLTALNSYILSENPEAKKKNLEIVQAKSNLFILYFGPDNESDEAINLLDKTATSNKAKNEKIVALIQDICSGAEDYFKNLEEIKDCEKSFSRCQECPDSTDMYNNCDIFKAATEPNRECEEHKNNILKRKSEYEEKNEKLKTNIKNLAEAMRIYLKIEWNRAKDWGKKDN